MNKLPSIVKSENIPTYCDTANVVREVFKSELEVDVDVSHRSEKVFEEYNDKCRELQVVERELMTKEIVKLLLGKTISLEFAKEETESFSYNLMEKFCIIKNSEISPVIPYGFNSNTKRNLKCQIISERKPVLPVVTLPKQVQIECAAIKERKTHRFLRPIVEKSKLPVLLVAEPSKVYFLAYKVGNIYKRQVKLQTVGSFGCHFKIEPPVTGSPFAVDWEVLPGHTKLIAPGQSMILKILFHCQGLYNITEDIVVYVKNGKDVIISLVACRPDPFLIVSSDAENIPSYLEFSNYDSVLCHTVECGRYLLGTKTTTVLTLLNIGSDGRFFIMSEKSWYSLDVDNLKEDNSLCLDEFDICPVYFSVKHNQVVDIYTTVTASHPGLYLSHAKVLCDNCTVEYLDFLAEALTFKSEWIEFNNMKKTFDIDIEDNIEAEFYIDLGEQLCTAIVPYTFFLYNSGGVNLNYHWEIKKANIPGTEGLTEDVLNIDQKSGIILAKNQHTTTICCNILSALPGRYRMLIVLIIDDLPRKCVEMKDSHFIIDESEENVVSLKVGVIEVWLECVRPCVVINPFSLDLSTELLQCGQMEFIEFEVSNESPGCVDISIQLPASSLHALLYCEPAVFDIDKLSSVKFILIIEPITSGFFTQILKCIVNSGEMVLDVLVKGKCSSGFLTSPEFCLDFGVVKKYYRPSKKIKVKSHYHNKVRITFSFCSLYNY